MNSPTPARSSERAPSPERTLRRLFLTLFLRGRTSLGLQKESAPKSVGSKLTLTLLLYGLFGLFAIVFTRQSVFALSVYLHAMTLMFLGLFVAGSAGEVLFNKEEADILLHRPVSPRALLWAKVAVLTEVSLWLAAAFNGVGLLVGIAASDGGWLFPIAHAASTALEALFCTACVTLVYQLCLRWFGRERLDNLMTAAQVLVAVGVVLSGQMVPLVTRFGGKLSLHAESWWVALLPPAWFAAMDDALAGSRGAASWVLAALGLAVTLAVLWLAFGKLAREYETGLQALNETISRSRGSRAGRRWLDVLVGAPPLRWWLRDPVSRASFLLVGAYLVRDREVKLRVYPALVPMLVWPVIALINGFSRRDGPGTGGFFLAAGGSFLGLMPMFGLDLLRFSQNWQASDVFRAAPMLGPASLCDGARRATMFFLGLPAFVTLAVMVWLLPGEPSRLALVLPGLIALPVFALIPCIDGKAVPFSRPGEEAKAATRSAVMFGVSMIAMLLAGLAAWSWSEGWLWLLLLVESGVAAAIYLIFRASLATVRWRLLE